MCMASGIVAGEGKGGERGKQRYSESKVYTRKAFKGSKKSSLLNSTVNSSNPNPNPNPNHHYHNNNNNNTSNNHENNVDGAAENDTDVTITAVPNTNDHHHNNKNDNNADRAAVNNTDVTATAVPNTNGNSNHPVEIPAQPLPLELGDSAHQQPGPRVDTAASDDCSSFNKQVAMTGELKPSSENQVKINLASRSKQEMGELRRKLVSELDLVRSLVKRIEAKEAQIRGFSNAPVPLNNAVDYGFNRVQPELASVGISQEPLKKSRPLNQLNISALENSQGVNENLEKEKRTPKANQFYCNSEFLLAKDKFPPAESNKKLKLNGKKQGGGEFTHGFGMGNKFFKSCSSLLERLMKHKHGWVFNSPVDVKGLGLHDYYSVIKHPMDLGTVKTRLGKNWYKSPREFAEDVRLTFQNAMTYNPKGQDVHVMAEQLSKIFEGKWASIEADYIRDMRLAVEYDVSLRMPTPRKAHSLLPLPLDTSRILDRSESMTRLIDPRPKLIATTPLGRTPAPKKPKAKDPYKRDMTYEEKQKLSTNLQSLPSEKLDNIVQIIKRRDSTVLQHDDEIEVDIDSVDTETLWELDRFITNYKKSLSKSKRKAELSIQARAEAVQIVPEKLQTMAPVLVEVPKETTTNEQNVSRSLVEEKPGDAASRSSSSSSSSSDSGSSSSDSDSESSSASGSDAGHSPRA
ncbi:transcription factor GTE4-like isoform X2 [Gossypium arboreum]|uniref:transcription factor GTE4-like isoform X2 n=1 Tax=Gossypium arboreum TaxID=29729 RepID=UPI0008190711|nr:transcription factor GTE4-like isoform X2 [Gossypium arboreum]XP_052882932.1 transcription factor GTE4-like isoform X2 [Gossypium arboreum]XP_052882933.1 transcription factor GTE4-like isoform X2 [Gossypium arboreum]XP_052882934.1 transcription factor GTE4-like isoform X2 [Gossypium arboreum]